MTEHLGEFDTIAPGAFASQVGKVVPVKGSDGEVIGSATVVDGNGRVEITTPDIPGIRARVAAAMSIQPDRLTWSSRPRPHLERLYPDSPAILATRTPLESAALILADAEKFLDRCRAAAGPAFDYTTWSAEWPGLAALIERTPPP